MATTSFVTLTAGSVKKEVDAIPDDVNKVSRSVL